MAGKRAHLERHRWLRHRGLTVSLALHSLVLSLLGFLDHSQPSTQHTIGVETAFAAADSLTRTQENIPETVVQATFQTERVTRELLEAKIHSLLAGQKGALPAEQMNRLTRMASRLEQVSSEASMDELTGKLRSWLGLESRAMEPAAVPCSRPFEFDTAQLFDVRRVSLPAGAYRYVALLLDAAGRSLEVELEPAEGERLYELMQRLRAHPLLEKLYRRVAMPLLDQMLGSPQGSSADASSGIE